MKTRRSPKAAKAGSVRRYFHVLCGMLAFILLLSWFKQSPEWVERYYSRGFYPLFAHVPKLVFGWVAFSVGDVLYALLLATGCFFLFSTLVASFRRRWPKAALRALQLCCLLFGAYLYFQLSWGLHYYRIPLHQQMGLDLQDIDSTDYHQTLDSFINRANALRASMDGAISDRVATQRELEGLMRASGDVLPMLSRTQVHAKQPLSSKLASYFTVTGYLNPFTQEVQVNAKPPTTSYPFTVVHELAHQMGIGFEDECNFLAFVLLHQHANPRYAYAAYYETINYLLRPLYVQDRDAYDRYVARLSPAIRQDYQEERLFWQRYTSTFERLMGLFYGGYLKHNNQPEGIARYSMMSRLVIAWEKKQH